MRSRLSISRLSFCPIVIAPLVDALETLENSTPAKKVAAINVTARVNFLIIANSYKSIGRFGIRGPAEGTTHVERCLSRLNRSSATVRIKIGFNRP